MFDFTKMIMIHMSDGAVYYFTNEVCSFFFRGPSVYANPKTQQCYIIKIQRISVNYIMSL